MTWEQMANEQIQRIADLSPALQLELLRNSLVAFGQQVDRATETHIQYIADKIAECDARIAAGISQEPMDIGSPQATKRPS